MVTDSFHGTVFSILHNIPFVAIGNKGRGLSRFKSVLKMFGVEDRLVVDVGEANVDEYIKKEIDWEAVNILMKIEREKSIEFLFNNLK